MNNKLKLYFSETVFKKSLTIRLEFFMGVLKKIQDPFRDTNFSSNKHSLFI